MHSGATVLDTSNSDETQCNGPVYCCETKRPHAIPCLMTYTEYLHVQYECYFNSHGDRPMSCLPADHACLLSSGLAVMQAKALDKALKALVSVVSEVYFCNTIRIPHCPLSSDLAVMQASPWRKLFASIDARPRSLWHYVWLCNVDSLPPAANHRL